MKTNETKTANERRLQTSIKNYTPAELKMYNDLILSGDTHSDAIETIKGERLMLAYIMR